MQSSLFQAQQAPALVPRWYQLEAREAIRASLEVNRSTLLVMATGLGKTFTFAMLALDARKRGQRVLVLAHTEELVEQNRRTLRGACDEEVFVEQGPQSSPAYAGLVSGSFQSVTQRLDRMGKDRFDLLIVDEAHHSIAKTYLRVLNWFESAKVIGVTATPDRGDGKALGRVYDDVAYLMDIVDGIDAGFLVNVEAHDVDIKEINLSGVSTQGGDLAQGELDHAIFAGVEGIVKETLRLWPDRAGIMFFPGVHSAEAASVRFNALKPGSAVFLCGSTPPVERRKLVADFRAGKHQYLCNCQIATEGFDAPHVSLIGFGRPTCSRALAAQMAGRGTRPLPGTVDDMPHEHQAGQRRLAILMSDKPNMVLANFVGDAGRHELVTPSEILGGDYNDQEIKAAQKKAEEYKGGGETYDPLQELRAARARLQAIAAHVRSSVQATVTRFNPFEVLDVNIERDNRQRQRFGIRPPTEKQLAMLKGRGVDHATLKVMDRLAAGRMIESLKQRQQSGLATLKQMRALHHQGIHDQNIRFDDANQAIGYIKRVGPNNIEQEMLNMLLGRSAM